MDATNFSFYFYFCLVSDSSLRIRDELFFSMFPIFFMIVNAFFCLLASFWLCKIYVAALAASKSNILWNYFKALIFNVFGGYYFKGKIHHHASMNNMKVEVYVRFGVVEVFYVLFVIISVIVSLMMSKGVGANQ